MGKFWLSKRSLDRLLGVHPDLVRVVRHAIDITPVDFGVREGLRSERRQRELLAAGASQTMKGRHLTGHAVDLGVYVDGELRWDWPLYHMLAPAVKLAGKNLGIPIEAGADWIDFPDGPHFQLPRGPYPP